VNQIYIGTSGYSYEDWKGFFYPAGVDSKEYLCYYSSFFNTVELNFTYYCFPNVPAFSSMCEKVKDLEDFIFSVKANKIFTHQREYSDNDAKNFTDSLKPLKEFGRLGSILFQFPYSFKYNNENIKYLAGIGQNFAGYEISIEFRNQYWLNDNVLKVMKDFNIGFCNVDEPALKGLLPQTDICTTDNGYIRFHGRNRRYWWEHENAYQRYDYMYDQGELEEWIPKVKNITEKSKKTYIYFNNHYKGKAAKSAMMFLDLLKSENIYTSQK